MDTDMVWIRLLGVMLLFFGIQSCSQNEAQLYPEDIVFQPFANAITPIPTAHHQSVSMARLGQSLFHDVNLSGDNTVSCASCHDVNQDGVDHLPASVGIKGQLGSINAPTVLNSSLNFRQFWDGRADSLEEQAKQPPVNPVEMGSNWPDILQKLRSNPDYVLRFGGLFDDGITQDTVVKAIATYERTLLTPNSQFDQYLKGDEHALSEAATRGYRFFNELGCISCHQGVNIGGNMYQNLGIMRDYFSDSRTLSEVDYGLFNVTGREQDRYKFKVPSLRNVAKTAPYFHDGSASTLDAAIVVMARYQLGLDLDVATREDVAAFLDALSAEPLTLPDS
ncbi:MAG: cytochrome c peroxidase [Candidatus Azotimanducaceae bacterium]|jgi:cytochrome c peroxidase